MRNVVDEVQFAATGRAREGVPRGLRQEMTIRAAIVGRGRHRARYALPSGESDGRTGQLPVGDLDPVSGHRCEHRPNVVGADLVTQAARPAVDHHADLTGAQTERRGHAGS